MQALLPPPVALGLKGLNALLQREPWARAKLATYAGKSVLIKLADKNILQATIDVNGGLQACDTAIVPDVILALPFTDVAELSNILRNEGIDGISNRVHIQGEAGLAQLLADLSRNLRWDAEADLARVFGDIAAVRIVSLGQSLINGLRYSAQNLQQNIKEYLEDETSLAVHSKDFEMLQSGVTSLHTKLDELDTRIDKLAGV